MVVAAGSGEDVYQRGQCCHPSKEQHRGAQGPSVEEPMQPATGDRTSHDHRSETHTEQHLVDSDLLSNTERGQ